MHPILVRIGPLTIYSYGFMIAIGIMLSLFLINKNVLRSTLPAQHIMDYLLTALFSGIVGARLFYVILNVDEFSSRPLDIFKIWQGGLILYGGIIAAVIVLIIMAYYRRIAFLCMSDILVPYLAFTQSFGRIGCFLNGCCWGRPTASMWGVTYPFLNQAVHPVQIYESLVCLCVSIVLALVCRRQRFKGQTTALYFILYPLGRFFLEYFRGDQITVVYSLTRPQITSIIFITLASIFYWLQRTRKRT